MVIILIHNLQNRKACKVIIHKKFMFLIERSWPHFSEPQLCCNHIYITTIAKISNRHIQNGFSQTELNLQGCLASKVSYHKVIYIERFVVNLCNLLPTDVNFVLRFPLHFVFRYTSMSFLSF